MLSHGSTGSNRRLDLLTFSFHVTAVRSADVGLHWGVQFLSVYKIFLG